MADVLTGDTAVDAVKQTLILNYIQKELIAKPMLRGTILDMSQFAVSGADELEFPKLGSASVVKKVSGTAVSAAALTYGTDKMLLDQHAVVQWLIEKKAKKQAVIELEMANLERAVSAMSKQVDVDIHAALIAGVSVAAPDHQLAYAGADFAKEDILVGMNLLDQQEYAAENRFIAVNPAEHKALLLLADFIDASKYGSAMPIQNGEIGQIYGAKVIKTTVVTAGRPLMYHMDAAAIGFQLNPEFAQQMDLANLATRYSVDQLYGLKVFNSGKGVVRFGAA